MANVQAAVDESAFLQCRSFLTTGILCSFLFIYFVRFFVHKTAEGRQGILNL